MNKVILVLVIGMSGCATANTIHETCNPITGECYWWKGVPKTEEKTEKEELKEPVAKQRSFTYPEDPFDPLLPR